MLAPPTQSCRATACTPTTLLRYKGQRAQPRGRKRCDQNHCDDNDDDADDDDASAAADDDIRLFTPPFHRSANALLYLSLCLCCSVFESLISQQYCGITWFVNCPYACYLSTVWSQFLYIFSIAAWLYNFTGSHIFTKKMVWALHTHTHARTHDKCDFWGHRYLKYSTHIQWGSEEFTQICSQGWCQRHTNTQKVRKMSFLGTCEILRVNPISEHAESNYSEI